MIRRTLLRAFALTTVIGATLFPAQAAQTATEQKLAQLEQLIAQGESKGVDVEREKMTLHTARLFLTWADWDEANQATVAKYYEKHPETKEAPERYAAQLPVYERESVELLLDAAIDELTLVNSGEIIRKPVELTDYAKVVVENGGLYQDGKPVFIGAYTWKPDEEETNKYYGNLNSNYISPNLFTNAQWDYKSWKFDDYADAQGGPRIGQTFIAQTIPDWAVELYPEIDDAPRIFHDQDIDHPFSRTLYQKLLEVLVPELKDKRSTDLGYMLFNEPTFITLKDSWNNGLEKLSGQKDDLDSETVSVTPYTLAKFNNWLKQQHGEISRLNVLWATNFASFEEVSLAIPIDESLRGSPQWYDWCRFNMARATEWFQFLDSEIKKHDPAAKTHIKLMPWLWSKNQRDHGMDFETLLMLGDIIGFDAKASYSHLWGKDQEWAKQYSFDWQSAIMSFDFFSSVQPNQLLWDSENHFFTSSTFMERDIDPNYVRAIYWMAFTHGLQGSSTWVWTRNADGDFTDKLNKWGAWEATDGDANMGTFDKEYIVDVGHQPKGLHALTRTLLEANAHGDDLMLLKRQPKPIRFFYSETSAISQEDHMTSIREAYKALYFEGMALGFVTQNIIENEIGQWQLVVIANAERVTDGEFETLQGYLNNGGTVLVDAASLTLNEYGQPRAERLSASKGQLLSYTSVADLRFQVQSHAASHNYLTEISVTEQGSHSHKTIAWRSVKRSDSSYALSLVNTGKSSVTVSLGHLKQEKSVKVIDLFTGQSSTNSLKLAPRAIKFLQLQSVDESKESDSESNSAASGGGPLGVLPLAALVILFRLRRGKLSICLWLRPNQSTRTGMMGWPPANDSAPLTVSASTDCEPMAPCRVDFSRLV